MQNSLSAGAKRPVILYIIIAIALFLALILTVRWAKSRADQYSQAAGQGQTATKTEGSQPQGTPDDSQPAVTSSPQQNQSQQSQASSSNQESAASTSTPRTVANTGSPAVKSVPATGPEQLVLPIATLSALVFAASSYVRARRRFAAQSLAK